MPTGSRRFTRWYVQLWAESLGKDGKGTTPIAALGPVDQHSQLQLFIAGPRDKLFTVITTDGAGMGPRIDRDLAEACRRAGSWRQDHRRSGRRAGPRHGRNAGQERLPGAHYPSRRASTRKVARRTADAFHAGDDHRRAASRRRCLRPAGGGRGQGAGEDVPGRIAILVRREMRRTQSFLSLLCVVCKKRIPLTRE